ncbi:MAG: YraN family protein [Acidimicrobiaceae bacterium]
MGVGSIPQEPVRAEGAGTHVQGRERGGAADGRPVDLARQARGRFGEEQAARWYRANGYTVVARNWRCATGEIDLVVIRDDTVVFVEVKARASDRFGSPALAVDARKQARLRRLGAQWLAAHAHHRVDVRFDVVAVTGTRVEVIEAAF